MGVHATPISFGETVSGTIVTPGQTVSYTFSANAGDTIFAKLTATWVNYPQMQLYAPDGSTVIVSKAAWNSVVTEITQTLPSTGTYTLLVGDAEGDNTGSYGLYLQRTNNPGNAVSIAYGETKSGSISRLAQMNNYTFSATAGDTVFAKLTGSWVNYPQIRLYMPNGSTVIVQNAGWNSVITEITKTLPLTGTYTLLVGDAEGESYGACGLYLQRTNNPGNAVSIAYGETRAGSISTLAQMNNYSFSANACDTINAKLTGSWVNYPQIRLYAPDGSTINVSNAGWNSVFTEIKPILPLKGNYTLLAGDAEGESYGTYGLNLQFLGCRCPLPVVKFTTNTSSGCAPLAVRFIDQSKGLSVKMWNWSFGDGTWFNTTVASQKNPAHVYGAGTFTSRLTVCNASGCNTTVTGKNITAALCIPPIIKFMTNVSSGYAPLAVKFIDASTGSPTKWNWSFGDGTWFNTTMASLKNPTHIYTSGGTYTAKLNACNVAGCNTTGPTKTITVSTLTIPIVKFTSNRTSGTAPLPVKFYDLSTGSPTEWRWGFGDGTWFNTTVTTLKNPAHIYTAAGSYPSRLIACNAAGCNTTAATRTITAS